VQPLLNELPALWQSVRQLVGAEPLEKFRYQWKFVLADLVFAAVYVHWLTTHQVLSNAQCSQRIGCAY
jgi:hypothetical protein